MGVLETLPCLVCRKDGSDRAREEIARVYLAAMSGRLPPPSPRRSSGPLPVNCCRRPRERVDAMALVG